MTIVLARPLAGKGDGDPRFYLPGSGLSLPGLEAIIEYNGIYLHNRQVVDRYWINKIDGLDDADVRDSRDANPSDDGETPFNAYYGGRTIVITGEIRTGNIPKMRDMQEALKAAFNDISQERPLYIRTGSLSRDAMISCKKVGKLEMAEEQRDGRWTRPFQITLRASNPAIVSAITKSSTWQNAGGPATFGPAVIFVCTNNGTYKARPIIRFDGPMASGKVTNLATGESVTVTNVPSGRYFLFNTQKKTLKDGSGNNQYNNLSDDSSYLKLNPNDNTMQFTGSGLSAASAVSLTWQDTWM